MVYGVTIQTLDRCEGNGMTMLFLEAADSLAAEARAQRIAQARFHCEVLVDHSVPCPGFSPSPGTGEPS